LGTVNNPGDHPTSWRLEQRKVPYTICSADREVAFGAAVVQVNDWLYVYGTDEAIKPTSRARYLIVARVALPPMTDFAAWRFYDGRGWATDFRASHRLVYGMASEGSVSYLSKLKQYVLVYTDGGMSDRILVRTAPEPTGPWSASAVIYRCPEAGRDK